VVLALIALFSFLALERVLTGEVILIGIILFFIFILLLFIRKPVKKVVDVVDMEISKISKELQIEAEEQKTKSALKQAVTRRELVERFIKLRDETAKVYPEFGDCKSLTEFNERLLRKLDGKD
jgi:hypothetical protein